MLNMRRILCPTDFSDTAQHALEHAVALARWYGSRITVLHVRTSVPPVSSTEPPNATLPTDLDRQEIEKRLRTSAAPADAAGVQADVEFEEGSPAARILDRAASLAVDLIVMGTHGRGGFDRLLLGSIAEKVIRKASCPVLTVPPRTESTSRLPFKRLLCPVDFSEPSMAALRFALSIAKESDADIMILRVFECPPDAELLAGRAFDILENRHQVEEQTKHQIDALISDEERNWCKPTTRLSFGKPYREILTIAENEKIDLIVMGVHGSSARDLTLFGSTTNHVVRQARCPVLTLRP